MAVTLLFGGCAAQLPATVAVDQGGAVPSVDASGGGPRVAALVSAGAKPIASSNYLSLYLDEGSKTVIIQKFSDTAFSTNWSVLGQDARYPNANAGACAAEITVIVNGKRIVLNTQDHSVAYGRAQAQRIENGVRVQYFLFPNRETAAKREPDKSDVAFVVGINYTLHNGNFYVEADWRNHSGNPDAFIESIGLMERFGALRQPGPDDFLLLPDGSGALLYPARRSVATGAGEDNALRFPVYGNDPGLTQSQAPDGVTTQGADGAPLAANLAAFGACQGKAAFLAVIERGAAVATITAQPAIAGEILQSSVGARFLITPTTLPESGKAAGAKILRAAKSYGENAKKPSIKLCYRFFFGDNATYSTMAVACREELISCNLLSSTKVVDHPEKGLPLNLTVLGSAPDEKGNIKALSRFDETLDVLNRLWRAGIANINVRYLGALSGGPKRSEPEVLSPLAKLNGTAGLEELQQFCATNTLDLFLETNLLPLGGKRKGLQALNLEGNPLRVGAQQDYRPLQLGDESVTLRSVNQVDSSVRAVLKRLGELNVTGLAVGDLGRVLYSDYSAGGITREEAAQYLVRYMPPLSAQWRILLDTGYFHIIRTADVVVNLPLDTQVKMATANRYEAIPFLQILLHGSMDYSGTPLNLANDPKEAFLRSIEYGACPSFTWYCAKTDAPSDAQLHFTGKQQDIAASYYIKASKALGDLRDARILRHSRLKDLAGDTQGVTATEYGNDTVIYVNHNDVPIKTISGLTIPAKDFVRIG